MIWWPVKTLKLKMMGCSRKIYSMGHSRKKNLPAYLPNPPALTYFHSLKWKKNFLLENIGTILVVFRNPSRKKGGYLLIHHRKQRPYHRNKDLSLLCWIHHRNIDIATAMSSTPKSRFFINEMMLSLQKWRFHHRTDETVTKIGAHYHRNSF